MPPIGVMIFFDSPAEAAKFVSESHGLSPTFTKEVSGTAAPIATVPPSAPSVPATGLTPPATPPIAPSPSAPTPPVAPSPAPTPTAASPSDHVAPVLAAMREAGNAVKAAGGNPAGMVQAVLGKFGLKTAGEVAKEISGDLTKWFEWVKANPSAPIP